MDPLRRAFRGYEPAQVDQLLAEAHERQEGLERELQALRAENRRLADEATGLRTQIARHQNTETAIQDALISAHRQADEVLAQARRESEILLQVAREASTRLQEDLRGRIDDLNWQIERLSLQRQGFLKEFQTLLEGHLSELAENPGEKMRSEQVEISESITEVETPSHPEPTESSHAVVDIP